MIQRRSAGIAAMSMMLSILGSGCADRHPVAAGETGGVLAPCPHRPNCVSSMAEDAAHHVAPLPYATDRARAREALQQVIAATPRAAVVDRRSDYIHVTFKSRVFGFVDDVEFYFPPNEPVIHVRSASRTGYSDFGVNRKRVAHLRQRFAKTLMSE